MYIQHFRLIPSVDSTSLNCSIQTENLGFFSATSDWDAIASPGALLNAPLNRQYCSDNGKRRRFNSQAPVNSSTYHRNKKKPVEKAEKGLVVNSSTCCYFGNFIKRKHSWRNCFL